MTAVVASWKMARMAKVDIDTKAETDEQVEQAKPAPGRAKDKAIAKLCQDINRLMGPGGDVVDVRVRPSVAAA